MAKFTRISLILGILGLTLVVLLINKATDNNLNLDQAADRSRPVEAGANDNTRENELVPAANGALEISEALNNVSRDDEVALQTIPAVDTSVSDNAITGNRITLVDRFESETIDLNWAADRQLEILKHSQEFSEQHPDLILESVKCKYSICKLEFLSYNDGHQLNLEALSDLFKTLPWAGETMAAIADQGRSTRVFLADNLRLNHPPEPGLILSLDSEQGRYVTIYHSAPSQNPANCYQGQSDSKYVLDLDNQGPNDRSTTYNILLQAYREQKAVELEIDSTACWMGSAIISHATIVE